MGMGQVALNSIRFKNKNIEHRTSDIEHPIAFASSKTGPSTLGVGCWLLAVSSWPVQ
jgi:hypothetical protein